MLVITKEKHQNISFGLKVYIQHNIHSVAVYLFPVRNCRLLAYFWITQVRYKKDRKKEKELSLYHSNFEHG